MTLSRGLYVILLGSILLLSCLLTSSNAETETHQIHHLRPRSGSAGCRSWQFAVETNNLRDWKPSLQCEGYLGQYMMGAQYRKDCAAVTAAAYDYVKSLKLNKDGKDIWIFDIDETSLSHSPYFSRPDVGFGALPYNATSFNEWQLEAKAPAIPSVLNLYRRLLQLGVKIVFLSGTKESYRESKERNMRNAGYHTWEMFILKQVNESSMKSMEFKSMHRMELEKMGYRIIGNMGDQWTDLLGPHPGLRTFKLPNPMYYIS